MYVCTFLSSYVRQYHGTVNVCVVEEEFQTLQDEFMEKYYREFENTDENKFVYTDIHTEYVSVVFVNDLLHRLCIIEVSAL